MKSLGWRGLALVFLGFACGGEEMELVGAIAGSEVHQGRTEQALFGSVTYGSECTSDEVQFLNKTLAWGRKAAMSSVFEECLRTTIQNAQVATIGGSQVQPYFACNGDPFKDDTRTVQFTRALQIARSPNALSIGCYNAQGGGNAATGQNDGYWHQNTETLGFATWLRNGAMPNRAQEPWPYSQAADIIWHEALHTHGYQHGDNSDNTRAQNACGYSGSTTWNFQQNTMPYLVGQCIAAVLAASGDRCNLRACDDGSVNLIAGRNPIDGCTCAKQDATGDRNIDLVLAGGPSWTGIRVGASTGNASFDGQYRDIRYFDEWMSQGGEMIGGDFNGDGLLDYALVKGGWWWNTIPVAFAKKDGTYNVTNQYVANFPEWSRNPNATVVSGDFTGDGRDDLALVGGYGWWTTPLAFSLGDGVFGVINPDAGEFAQWAQQAGAKPMVGDFDGDGLADIALTGGYNWWTIPVRFTRSGFQGYVTNWWAPDFPTWATHGSTPLAGDFDGDGTTDLALTGGSGWNTIPVAFSYGDGGFNVTNNLYEQFATWATQGSKPVVGDFNGDNRDDIALVGGQGWGTVPVASGVNVLGLKGFLVSNNSSTAVAYWASQENVRPVTNVVRPPPPIEDSAYYEAPPLYDDMAWDGP